MSDASPCMSPAEEHAWLTFVRMHQRVNARLVRDLQAQSRLSVADYQVLMTLTDAPDGRRRFQDLVKAMDWEQSRLSHQIARMTRRGVVTRAVCPDGERTPLVVITPQGRELIEAAAPRYVATVRRLVIDALTPNELATLARISGHILEQLDDTSP